MSADASFSKDKTSANDGARLLLDFAGVNEVFQLLRKKERERLKHEFEKREKEEKVSAVWERIKKRRLETKHDMDVALCVIQEGVREIEEKQLNILKKILQVASKYWDPVSRKKYESKLKEQVVLLDIKVRHLKARERKRISTRIS